MIELIYLSLDDIWIHLSQVCTVRHDEECDQYILTLADGAEATMTADEFNSSFKTK